MEHLGVQRSTFNVQRSTVIPKRLPNLCGFSLDYSFSTPWALAIPRSGAMRVFWDHEGELSLKLKPEVSFAYLTVCIFCLFLSHKPSNNSKTGPEDKPTDVSTFRFDHTTRTQHNFFWIHLLATAAVVIFQRSTKISPKRRSKVKTTIGCHQR